VLVIPSIDLEGGRSRVVFWPGASTGVGAPTDRPDRIAVGFVERGAKLVHLVDFDGARAGSPVNLELVGAVASRIAVPLQLAGGLDGPDQIRLAFAAGATRAVVGAAVADQPQVLRDCLAVAGDWLAVGLDPRPERLAAFPWQRPRPPTLDDLVGELTGAGVGRYVLAHGGSRPDTGMLSSLIRTYDVEVLVAGGAGDLDAIRRLRDAGVAGVILGEPLYSGAIDYPAALAAAA
jgi:phosphoribosylformimino-5-aminoimidazole carboxamide ribotide isomerase